ncbi:MAG TPA: BadF/BadG/BcrA/BcrD ATPase family protein [Candidatus Baltobacteraceae bacterium]|nr:BadF/BadG/BcrA/BcrD ATPase family protein [Candidatus Baltobacteraceae bacterium]
MKFVAGIDAGQSSTTAVVVDERGYVRGRGTAGPADHVDEPPGSSKCADACAAAVDGALRAAGLPTGTELEAVRIGLSGYDAAFDGRAPTFAARSVSLVHDAPVALAGAIQTRPAVVTIAGTGSVAYGEDASGAAVRVGGWGYLFGDEGSAFAVARDALAHAMAADDRGERTPLAEAALAYFDRPGLRDLATAALQGRISRSGLAAFAQVVHDAARLGQPDAVAIVNRAADALARLGAVALDRLGLAGRPVPVAFAGGAFRSENFARRVREQLLALAPGAQVVVPRYDAAVGAALLAFADADLAVPVRVVEG